MYKFFNKRHPRFKVIRNKEIGVALLKLPTTFEDYLKGKEKQALRTNRNAAIRAGLRCEQIDPKKYITDILEINTSAPKRQNLEIDPSYTSHEQVEEYFSKAKKVYGVFDSTGLKAYAHIVESCEVFVFNRLMGHKDYLDKGIMYFLVSEIVKDMIAQRGRGALCWGMYDTMLLGSNGLRYFKERLGFEPYRVEWKWVR
jgi:hypothetical protein